MLFRNRNLSLGRIAYLTGLQLAFFCDAATTDDSFLGMFRAYNSYIDTGIGIRSHVNILGTIPTIIAVELAYLLPVLGAENGGFNAGLAFSQPF